VPLMRPPARLFGMIRHPLTAMPRQLQEKEKMSIISTSFRGDLKGGAASALLTIPPAIGFGLFAFAPLGERFTQFAILAGLYSAIIVPSVGVILRSNSPVVLAPRSMTSFLISGVIIHLLAVETAREVNDPSQLLTVVFLIMLAAGIFQSLFGVLHLGELVKYIPHPVIAGFQNGAALLLLLAQIDPMLGLHDHVPIAQILNNIALIQPLTLTVGVVSYTLMMNASRLTKRIPAVINLGWLAEEERRLVGIVEVKRRQQRRAGERVPQNEACDQYQHLIQALAVRYWNPALIQILL